MEVSMSIKFKEYGDGQGKVQLENLHIKINLLMSKIID